MIPKNNDIIIKGRARAIAELRKSNPVMALSVSEVEEMYDFYIQVIGEAFHDEDNVRMDDIGNFKIMEGRKEQLKLKEKLKEEGKSTEEIYAALAKRVDAKKHDYNVRRNSKKAKDNLTNSIDIL